MFRYTEVDDKITQLFIDVLEESFPEYIQLNIKLLFDTKKRVNKGKLVLASIEIPNEKVKFFTANSTVIDGYDYIMIVNYTTYELATDVDIKRIISHELQHIFIDESGNCKLVSHDVEDFQEEIEKNADDPRWAIKLTTEVQAKYDEMKNGK